jgi:outer membrane protein assembly factor BamB
MLIISTGNGVKQDHKTYATPDHPCLVALDKNTGKIVAADEELICRKTFHGQWSSPSLVTINGKQQIVWGGGDGVCYAFETTPAPGGKYGGVLKKIWSYDVNRGNTKVYKSNGGPSEIIATPTVFDNKIYVSTGQDWTHGNPKCHVACIDPTKTGTIAEPVWDYTDVGSCVGSVAVDNGLAYVADLGGIVHCIDAVTGKLVWKSPGGAPFHSSPTIADGKLFVADTRGKMFIYAHGRTMKLLNTVDLRGESFGAAIAANQTLYITSARMLQAVAKPDK